MFTKHLHHHNALVATPPARFELATTRLTVAGSTAELQRNKNNRYSSAAVAPRRIPLLSHTGWISDSFFSRRCEHGCRQSVYDSGRFRTYDRLLRRQLLYPAELLSQTLVPIAADPEPGRESPQWSLNHPHIIRHVEHLVNHYIVSISWSSVHSSGSMER